ncbi:MAG: PDZ domain-containing protein [Myxococcota bacterium]
MVHALLASMLFTPPTTTTAPGIIRCAVTGDARFSPSDVHMGAVLIDASWDGDTLTLFDAPSSGEGKVRLGQTQIFKDVRWENGQCETIALPEAIIYGTVSSRGDQATALVACGEIRWIPANATTYVFELPRTDCTIAALRKDGLLDVYASQPVAFDRTGLVNRFDVDLPETFQGGMGISFQTSWQGVVVMRVLPGSPADVAGLTPGMLITALDGVSVVGWSTADFQRKAVGEIGAPIRLDMVTPEGTSNVTLRRAVID